jgi:hypothetical protein
MKAGVRFQGSEVRKRVGESACRRVGESAAGGERGDG